MNAACEELQLPAFHMLDFFAKDHDLRTFKTGNLGYRTSPRFYIHLISANYLPN
jgi:hypothetical protein